jgi:hypothetical protein
VPDPLDFQRRLSIETDLRVEVDDGGRLAAAHLRDEPAGLVLEMDQPAALLAAVSWRRLAGKLPVPPPRELVDGVSVRLRSQGMDLGRVRLTRTGRIRIRPTPAGLVAVVAADSTSRSPSSGRRPHRWLDRVHAAPGRTGCPVEARR